MVLTRKTLISTQIDHLTDEQIRKRAVGVEDVDQRGLVKRHRVLEQTLFDMLFLKDLIDQSQHEAAHMMMESISKSGAAIRSANLDTEVFTPHQDVSKMMGERRMAFSSAYRRLVEDVGVDDASRTMRFFVDIHHYPVEYEEQGAVARFLNDPLRSLASHYGTDGIRDPRSILRRLVGASQK